MENNQNKSRLCQLIEKIVDSKTISSSEQEEINRLAKSGDVNRQDYQTINDLTDMIGRGEINVN